MVELGTRAAATEPEPGMHLDTAAAMEATVPIPMEPLAVMTATAVQEAMEADTAAAMEEELAAAERCSVAVAEVVEDAAAAEDVAEVPHTNNMPATLILTTIIPCVESKQSSFFYNFSTFNTLNPVLWPGHCLP